MSRGEQSGHERLTHKISTLDGWRANALPLALSPDDLDLFDLVLCVSPQLRIVTFLGQEARRRRLTYPVPSLADLVKYLGNDSLEIAGHVVNAKTVADPIPEEWFPLCHEGELLSVVNLALKRCELDGRRAFIEKAFTAAMETTQHTMRKP